ncbi:MAG: polyprenyl synthetase family protein [Polyangiaceae bacterium]|jgi:geranylgeranyl diphosphate synthase, type I
MEDEFELFVASVRVRTDERLATWLEGRLVEAGRRGPDVEAVADAVRQLALRGGKRMRPVLLVAAYDGCEGEGGVDAVLPACVSLELLQAYLLVHDDWMDGDEMRRGGPSVPAMMRDRFAGKHGDAASILAGDLAAAWARQALLELDLPPARLVMAARELGRVEEDVVEGQLLDVGGAAGDLAGVEAVHALKTASYTVRGPVVMGARLGGASEAQVEGLTAFAVPLGVAFQLRDDVLGTFGDATAMGKPSGSDLRAGKRTSLVVEAMRDTAARRLLDRVLGHGDADDEEVRAAVERMEACGARARVEERIRALALESRAALSRTSLTPTGRRRFERAVVALTERQA